MKSVMVLVLALAALINLSGCDQYVARKYGGNLEFKLPKGAQLMSMAWKDMSLWVLYYEPATKRCVFAEDSAAGVIQGQVVIPDCNPVAAAKGP